MLHHHIQIFFRSIRHHRGSFIINLIGLSTGLACAILILLWVQDEWRFDKFHVHNSRLYQVMELSQENGLSKVHEATQGPLEEAIKTDLPEVEAVVQVMSIARENMFMTLKAKDKSARSTGIFASHGFFDVFSFPLLQGHTSSVLANSNNIVISETLANNIFGSPAAAIGQTLQWELIGQSATVMVSGVFAALPRNNSMAFDFVLTRDLLLKQIWTNGQLWNNEGPQTYLLLKKTANVSAFNLKIKDFIKKYDKGTLFSLFVRPYADGYLYGKYENGQQAGGRIQYVQLFMLAAIFILIIACINFMNLSTARATRRAREVGIRKVAGSTRRSLVLQFLTEAICMAILSTLVALVWVWLAMPAFNQITGKQLAWTLNSQQWMLLALITILVGLLSGSYPAFYLSAFRPIAVLKGTLRNSWGELMARKGLVVFQFGMSLILIVAVLVIYKQVQFIQNRDPGFKKDQVIHFTKEGEAMRNGSAFLEEMRNLPGVLKASAISQNIAQNTDGSSTYGIEWPGKNPNTPIDFVLRFVDAGLIETLGIQMSAGRSFSASFGNEENSVILNETAVKTMGLKNAIGSTLKMWGNDVTVVGVVKDFHVVSMHEAIEPMVLRYGPNRTTIIMASLQPGQEKKALAAVQALHKSFNPGYPLSCQFLDADYQAQYIAEGRVSQLSRWFAGLAVLISCLGLFGLATFNAEMRTREIGIRKVLGANASQVMMMLSKDYMKLMLVSAAIALPLAWWLMHRWLQGFAYRSSMSPMLFAWALIALLVIMMVTISYQAIRSAVSNPAKSLRTE